MPNDKKKKKVLLMGKSGSGKTSMRSVIFSNMIAKDTSRLGATMDVEHSHVVFMGGLKLNLWDCGGQENFLAHFISTQKSEIFKNVAVLIYVFDATTPTTHSASSQTSGNIGEAELNATDTSPARSPANGGSLDPSTLTEWEKDVKYFEECLEALYSLAQEEVVDYNMSSPDPSGSASHTSSKTTPPRVWVLINKMDLVGDDNAEKKLRVFEEKRDEIERRVEVVGKRFGMDVGKGKGVRCFGTSIWDESLYKAWSSVIHTLIPHVALITSHLTHLRNLTSSLEAVLFERQTFLVLAKSGSGLDADPGLSKADSSSQTGNTSSAGKSTNSQSMLDLGGLDQVEILGGARGLEKKRFEKFSEVIKAFRRTCQ